MRKNKEEQMCFLCAKSTPIAYSDVCVCSKRGVVSARDSCAFFKLDLLKIVPRRIVSLAPDKSAELEL